MRSRFIAIGQLVRVYYDPLNPDESGFCSFKEQAQSTIGLGAWLVAGIVLVGLFVFEKKNTPTQNH